MYCRMVSPRRVLMVLAYARKALKPQDHTIFRNTCPQINQVRTLLQVFPPRNFCSVAEAKVEEANHILSILKEKEWCHETEEKLNSISDISKDDILSALKTLDPENALCFFTWYKNHPSYKPTSLIYNAMLRIVGRKDYTRQFWRLAGEMKTHGFRVEIGTFLLVRSRFRKHVMGSHMAKLFVWMAENGEEKPSVTNCFEVLQCLSNNEAPDIDAAYSVVEAFRASGGNMQKVVYDFLHKCLTKSGRFEEAADVVDSMFNEGFEPDNITYGNLIHGLCNASRLEDAYEIIHEMKEKGCNSDLNTWSVIIEEHCFANKTDKVVELYWKMNESGCVADDYIIQGVALHLCSKNRKMDAYDLFCKSIEEHRIKPSYATYSEIIKNLTQSGMLKEACRVFDVMKEHKHVPFGRYVSLAQPIIGFLGKGGSVDDAYSFVSTIKKDWISGKACTAMVEAFCKENRQSEASDLLSRFPYHIAKCPQILSIINRTSSDNPKCGGTSLRESTCPKGKVTKKSEKSKSKTTNGDSISDKAEQNESSSDKELERKERISADDLTNG